MGRGRLTRKWGMKTNRSENDPFGGVLYHQAAEAASEKIVKRVAKLAKKRGLPRAQIALAWLLHKSVITAPIVGATKPEQLDDAIAALDVSLSAKEIAKLEAPYVPLNPVGFE